MTDPHEIHETVCIKCKQEPRRAGQRYGKKCHAEYQRKWRPMREERKIAERLQQIVDDMQQPGEMQS